MKKVTLLFVLSTLLFISCSDETTVYSEQINDVTLESNQQVLDDNVIFDASGVLEIFEENIITGKTSKAEEQAGDYPLTLVAQIKVPTFSGGESLTASHVDIEGNYVYVSYNTVEDGYAGALDIINISDPNNPIITSRLYYSNADINSVKYENGYVYAVGGVDSELSVAATSNSFIARIPVSNARFDVTAITYGFQEGFNATDVDTTDNSVLVTSGKDGTLTAYDKNNIEIIKEAPFADLRAITTQDDKIAVLDASIGILMLDQNFNTTKEIAIDSDFGFATKKTLSFFGDQIIVAEGSRGAGVYNSTTGNFIEYVPILINPEGVDNEDIVTNAVVTNEDVILMANGGAGLCLAEDNGNNADLVGIIELEGSINYVESKGDYIYAASGKAGLQIIKLNRPSESLVERCSTLDAYRGSSILNVDSGQTRAYNGSKRFSTLNIDGSLLLCGTWTSLRDVNVNANGLFEMSGILYVASNRRTRNVTVGDGGVLRIEGDLIVYGDLVLEDGATIEFLGDDSRAYITGDVIRSGNTTVSGNFEDILNKF